MKSLKRLLLHNLLVVFAAASVHADAMSGANLAVTKDLLGASGTPLMTSVDYALGLAWGEPISGDFLTQSTHTLTSGYFGGGFGNGLAFTVVSTQIGVPSSPLFFQDGVQVGLPFNAPIRIVLSDQVLPATIAAGVQALLVTDHLGAASGANAPISVSFNPVDNSLAVQPQGTWSGNTLYDIQLTPQLLSVDGFPLDHVTDVYFQTMLDPHEDNVSAAPLRTGAAGAPAAGATGVSAMAVHIPTESLPDFATVLLSRDALASPLRANPQAIQTANAKALASGGAYREPLSIQEVAAYDTSGRVMSALASPAQVTVDYASATGPGLPRRETLALWALDTDHDLWVKIPASRNAVDLQAVSASVTQLSTFALMGGPDGSAADSFVFPVPWRPHGPNAGPASGQSGTEASGITFSSIPSECTIKIYTIAGNLVRQIHHSDTGGAIAQEVWDVRTVHGDPAASGVYLWRVESSADGKNGKLMVIR